MTLLSFLDKVLRNVAQEYRTNRERERFLKEFRAEREAKIERGEAPPSFRSYDDYLQSEWWQRLRSHVLSHLTSECEFCGNTATQVHHVRYPRTSDLGSESIKSLYAVCARCHGITHGQGANTADSECAFCRSRATVTLKIAIRKYGRSTQRVCRRCDLLANGYRGQANKWAKASYEEWVDRWRQSMPPLQGFHTPPDLPQQDDEAARRDYDAAALATSARLLVLNERTREFSALGTDELRTRWDSREHSDYEEDELHLLRSVIRQRLGYVQ